MNAIVVEHSKRGGAEKLVSKRVPEPEQPKGHDLLVRIKAASVNPIDIKVRGGVYDDYPDYFDRCPQPDQICGFDGSGTVEAVGPSATKFKMGDQIFFSGSPIRQGTNAEYQLVDERGAAIKPKSLSFVEAASMPLTYITAYEALVERLEIKKGEKAALLIINGAGGVGSMASQIASKHLNLPAVITTASRPETKEFSKTVGATHVVNHREKLQNQISDLKLEVPLKYIFITHSTDAYLATCADIAAPFAKVCSIVQGKVEMYGTPFMAKSMSYCWALLGTKPYYGVDVDSHGRILKELADYVDDGTIKCTLKQTLPLTLEGLREAHRLIEKGGSIGKIGMEVPDSGEGFL